jgi:short-subunit dehydrogenase
MDIEPVQMNGDGVWMTPCVDPPATPEVVVVTGASAGVGRAAVRRFAAAGARIGLIARGIEGLEGARGDVEKLGGRAVILQGDVADAEFIEAASIRAEEELGPIDIWVNNATTTVFSPVKEMTAAEFRRVTEVAYLGFIHGTQSALRRMTPRNRGTIVQVGSALAFRGIPLQSAYCGAKHAIQGFTEALRTELMHDNINIHLTQVNLPAVNTPQFDWNKTRLPRHPQPVPPIYQPEVIAEAIYFAAHHKRREIMVGLPTLKAVYGNRIAPWLADRELAKDGYDSQQTDEPVSSDRPDNLWHPVAGDRGAHGQFDSRSRDFSPQLWADIHRSSVGLVVGMAGLMLAGAFAVHRTESDRSAARQL